MNPDFFTVAKTEEGDCGNDPEVIPEWMDEAKVLRGQEYYRKYFFSVYLSCLSALCIGFCMPSLVTTLVFTRESETIPKMFRRYLRTIQYMDKWYRGNIWDNKSETFRSIQYVRRIHNSVAARQMASDVAPTDGSVAVSQYDMVMTQFAFMGPVIVYPFKFGVWHSKTEVDGFIHFWRCIGYLLGIDDKYNLCGGTHKETVVKCRQLYELEVIPNLLNPPQEYEPMARNLLISLRPIIPGISFDSFAPFSYRILGVPFPYGNNRTGSRKKKIMSWVLHITANWLLFIPPFRTYFNKKLYKSIERAGNFTELEAAEYFHVQLLSN